MKSLDINKKRKKKKTIQQGLQNKVELNFRFLKLIGNGSLLKKRQL